MAAEKGIPAELPQPEPLTLLYMLRRFSLPYLDGGIADQPIILLMELNACINGEMRWQERVQKNMAAKLEFIREHVKSDG